MGSDLFGDFIAPHDAHLVRRLREAGCVIVGITNMPEMGIMPVTEPRRHGPGQDPGRGQAEEGLTGRPVDDHGPAAAVPGDDRTAPIGDDLDHLAADALLA